VRDLLTKVRLLAGKPIPVVLVLSTNDIFATIERYVKELGTKIETSLRPNPVPSALVAHATTTAPFQPLSQRDTKVLTDSFPSIRLLEEATRSHSGRNRIASLLGPIISENISDFWEDEWMVWGFEQEHA
jgi:hypothetical protein